MLHSPIRSIEPWFAMLALASVASCSDDDAATCGPGDAPSAGLTLTVAGEIATFGEFTAAANNDCTDFDSGVISVSIHGAQTGGARPFTLCLPRPDLIGAEPVALVPNRNPPLADDRVHVVDTSASLAGGCSVVRDPEGTLTGTATFEGYCDTSTAGYALALAGDVPLIRTCGGTIDAVTGVLGGRVAIAIETL